MESHQGNEEQIRALAHELGCVTEEEVQLLGDYRDTTLENHRKRGTGPAYILFGKRFLYRLVSRAALGGHGGRTGFVEIRNKNSGD